MTATTAIRTDLRREILRILQEDITYQVQEDDEGDVPTADKIIYQKTRVQKSRSYEHSNQTLDYPAILLSEPMRSSTLEPGGTNGQDLWVYRYLIQIVDNDLWENEGRIATWEKWQEQIISLFMFNGIANALDISKGEIWWSSATSIADIDESEWIRDGQFIMGVELTVKVLQPRGVIA